MNTGKLKRIIDFLVKNKGESARSRLSLKLGYSLLSVSEKDPDDEFLIKRVISMIEDEFDLKISDNI